MKCKCGSNKLRAVNFEDLDYVYYFINDKWVLSNPRLGYFYTNRRSYEIYCYSCRESWSYDGEIDQNTPEINHKEITLDLDHTLIYSEYTFDVEGYDFSFKDPNGARTYYVFKRPFLKQFIEFLSNRFEKINIFTAAQPWYAQEVLKNLNIPKSKMGFLKTSEDTYVSRPLSFEWESMKKMSDSLVVEDKPLVVEGFNNVIFKVTPYYMGQQDDELMNLITYLTKSGGALPKPKTVSGEISLFLKGLDIKIENMPFEKIKKISKIKVLTQEELDKIPQVRTQYFKPVVTFKDNELFISLVDISYSVYLKLLKELEGYTQHKKITKKDFDLLIETKYRKFKR